MPGPPRPGGVSAGDRQLRPHREVDRAVTQCDLARADRARLPGDDAEIPVVGDAFGNREGCGQIGEFGARGRITLRTRQLALCEATHNGAEIIAGDDAAWHRDVGLASQRIDDLALGLAHAGDVERDLCAAIDDIGAGILEQGPERDAVQGQRRR